MSDSDGEEVFAVPVAPWAEELCDAVQLALPGVDAPGNSRLFLPSHRSFDTHFKWQPGELMKLTAPRGTLFDYKRMFVVSMLAYTEQVFEDFCVEQADDPAEETRAMLRGGIRIFDQDAEWQPCPVWVEQQLGTPAGVEQWFTRAQNHANSGCWYAIDLERLAEVVRCTWLQLYGAKGRKLWA